MRLGQRVEIRQDEVAGLAHLDGLRGIHDVGRGQAKVQPSRGGPDPLGNGGRKRDHIVLRRLLDFLDARDVEACLGLEVLHRFGRNDAGIGHRVQQRQSRPGATFRTDAARSRFGPSRDG